MGLRSSKIKPESHALEFIELINEFRKLMIIQTAFYAKVLKKGQFNTSDHLYNSKMESKFEIIHDLITNLFKKNGRHDYKIVYNSVHFDYINQKLEFKRNLHRHYLDNKIVLHDELMKDSTFRSFFTLLPNVNDPYANEYKHRQDEITMQRQITGENTDMLHACPKTTITAHFNRSLSITDNDNTE